jgi:hypothetical protein
MIRYATVTMFLLVLFGFVLAPALQTVITELTSVMASSALTTSVIGRTTTFLFIGLPLLLLGGALVAAFFVAVGLRGTSFR